MNFKITTVKSFVFAGFLTIASDASAGINYLYNNVYSESFLSNSNKEEEASGKINELRTYSQSKKIRHKHFKRRDGFAYG